MKKNYAEIMEAAKEYMVKEKPSFSAPDQVANFIRPLVQGKMQEEFYVLYLDSRNRLIEFLAVTTGLVSSVNIHAREVFRQAIVLSTSRVILAHNHPSGCATPSPQDLECTRNLVQAGKIIGIEVMDHVVVGAKTEPNGKDFLSFRESNLI